MEPGCPPPQKEMERFKEPQCLLKPAELRLMRRDPGEKGDERRTDTLSQAKLPSDSDLFHQIVVGSRGTKIKLQKNGKERNEHIYTAL